MYTLGSIQKFLEGGCTLFDNSFLRLGVCCSYRSQSIFHYIWLNLIIDLPFRRGLTYNIFLCRYKIFVVVWGFRWGWPKFGISFWHMKGANSIKLPLQFRLFLVIGDRVKWGHNSCMKYDIWLQILRLVRKMKLVLNFLISLL